MEIFPLELQIQLEDPQRRDILFGPGDKHLRMIREVIGVQIFARDVHLCLTVSQMLMFLTRTMQRQREEVDSSCGLSLEKK